ncbi:MAG: hypothetical protein R6V25_15425 [Desulfatiglandales bacterium]
MLRVIRSLNLFFIVLSALRTTVPGFFVFLKRKTHFPAKPQAKQEKPKAFCLSPRRKGPKKYLNLIVFAIFAALRAEDFAVKLFIPG